MLALVTGSTGFLGSHLCWALLEAGYGVRAFHRPTSSLTLLQGLDVEYAVGDITLLPTLEKAMQGVEVVFHAASQVSYWRDSQLMYQVIVGGTRNVLKAAEKAGVQRVVYTSSVAALGVPEPVKVDGQPPLIDENHTWNYRPEWWRYGHAKHLAEMDVQRAVAQGLDAVITNPAIIFGPGDTNLTSGELVVRIAQGWGRFTIEGGINVVHAADAARGHLYALKRGRRGERYILGGVNLPIKHLFGIIAEVVGVHPASFKLPNILAHAMAPAFDLAKRLGLSPYNGELLRLAGRFPYYNTSKAERDLGYTWAYSPREMVQETYDWYRERGFLS
jgi:dihydroflavonol-4-reductase